MTEALRERLSRLAAALAHELPDATFTRPAGGYFLWVDFLATIDVDALFTAARRRGVLFVKGKAFCSTAATFPFCWRTPG